MIKIKIRTTDIDYNYAPAHCHSLHKQYAQDHIIFINENDISSFEDTNNTTLAEDFSERDQYVCFGCPNMQPCFTIVMSNGRQYKVLEEFESFLKRINYNE